MNVQKWKSALKVVANLSGFHSTNFGTDAKLIEEVVQRVLNRLNHMQQFDSQGLIGISKPIADLQSLIFCNGTEDVRVIGIWGMGGIGKTTIARALFRTHCSEYESCYFLENVKDQIEKYGGMAQLQTKLLSILLEEKDSDGTLPGLLRRLRRKKVLVVLDGVDNENQVRELVGGRGQQGWLGPGSRIIVTTRDKHVLRKEADYIYEVEALGSDEAMQLLTLHAFNGKSIQMECDDVMMKVVEYASGVPLALKVLGSFLYGKSVEEWRSQLEKLKKMPFEGIQKVLRLSYDGLDRHDQKILLYIVCFFKFEYAGYSLEDVKMLLDACGFSTTIALKTLQDRCLITIRGGFAGWKEDFTIHDLIRQMCQEIVCEEKIEKPGERHHLWDPNEICHVLLTNNKGTESIESIRLDILKINNDLNLSRDSFASMLNLKFLKIYGSGNIEWDETFVNPVWGEAFDNPVHAREDHIILPDNLRLLHWDGCPFKSLKSAGLENLVELRMKWSRLEKLWDGTQNLPNLRTVFLGHSKQLKKVPDLSKALLLELLNLGGCENLVTVHPSVFSLPKLTALNICYCKRLQRLPDIGVLDEEASGSASPSAWSSSSNLQFLYLQGCASLKYLPDTFCKLTSLQELFLSECKELDTSNLRILFDGLSSLRRLDMDTCYKLYEVPDNISNLSLLEELSLKETNVKNMPESIKHLSSLKCLHLDFCEKLESLPQIPPSLSTLCVDHCISLERVFTPTPQLLQQHLASYQSYLQESDRPPPGSMLSYYLEVLDFSLCNCPKLKKDAVDAILKYSKRLEKGRREIKAKHEGKAYLSKYRRETERNTVVEEN